MIFIKRKHTTICIVHAWFVCELPTVERAAIKLMDVGMLCLRRNLEWAAHHLFFLLVEGIKGSPVSARTLGYSQMVGMVLIVTLMVYVTYNDLLRWIGS